MEENVNHDENKNEKKDRYFVVTTIRNMNIAIVECIDSKQKFSINKFEQ